MLFSTTEQPRGAGQVSARPLCSDICRVVTQQAANVQLVADVPGVAAGICIWQQPVAPSSRCVSASWQLQPLLVRSAQHTLYVNSSTVARWLMYAGS